MDTKAFLRNIGSQSSVEDILSSLNEIKGLAESAPNLDPEIKTNLDKSIENVLGLQKSLRQLYSILHIYQEQADKYIPALKLLIDTTINDYKSAYDATQNYDKDFFANSMYSETSKQDLAHYILNAIKVYCIDNLETLTMICNGNNEIMQYISVPRLKT